MTSKEATQELMIQLGDDMRKKLVDELNKEKAFNRALQADNDRLHDLLDESEDNVNRLSLLMSNPRLKDALC